MKVLLDTNVLLEVRRPAPDPKVLAWLDAIDEDRPFISVASIAELRRGIALMDDGRRREALTPGSRRICRRASPGESCRSIRESPNAGAI